MTKQQKIAIYPGTFDPITFGHIDVIERASRVFDLIIVAVAYDTKKTTLFSLEERVDLIKAELKRINATNIIAKSFHGLLIDFAIQEKSSVIIRGLRAVSDFEYEFQMSYMNYKLNSDIQTVFFPATENGHFISSSFVKEVARLNGNLEGLVSNPVALKLKQHFYHIA